MTSIDNINNQTGLAGLQRLPMIQYPKMNNSMILMTRKKQNLNKIKTSKSL